MRRAYRLFLVPVLSLPLAAIVSGCGSGPDPAATAASANAAAVVQLAPENVTTATQSLVSSGPIISGQLTPAREATVRAMVGGSLVSLTVDRGERVAAGAEIGRITSRDLDAARLSAEAGVRSAQVALTVARNETTRVEALVKGGALAAREVEQARNAVAAAEAQVAAAESRVRSVQQQLDDTIVRAPFTGLVSARPANAGDVVAPGTELVTVVDPSSLRLEAQVPSDRLSEVKPGAKVLFTIRGAPGPFVGRVDRFDPTADPVTRQVSVFVTLPNTRGALISGLFAEGRIETVAREGIVIPVSAVDETGIRPLVTRVRSGKAERVPVTLGARQPDTETVQVESGIAAGDVLVVGSAKNLTTGTAVTVIR